MHTKHQNASTISYIITGSLLKHLISTRDPEFFRDCFLLAYIDLDDEQFIHSLISSVQKKTDDFSG